MPAQNLHRLDFKTVEKASREKHKQNKQRCITDGWVLLLRSRGEDVGIIKTNSAISQNARPTERALGEASAAANGQVLQLIDFVCRGGSSGMIP